MVSGLWPTGVQSVQDGREWTRGVGVGGTTWQDRGGIQGTPARTQGSSTPPFSTSGWSHRLAGLSIHTGLPRAKGHWSVIRTLPESLWVPSPLRAPVLRGQEFWVLREWVGAWGPSDPQQPLGSRKARLDGGGGSAPSKW